MKNKQWVVTSWNVEAEVREEVKCHLQTAQAKPDRAQNNEMTLHEQLESTHAALQVNSEMQKLASYNMFRRKLLGLGMGFTWGLPFGWCWKGAHSCRTFWTPICSTSLERTVSEPPRSWATTCCSTTPSSNPHHSTGTKTNYAQNSKKTKNCGIWVKSAAFLTVCCKSSIASVFCLSDMYELIMVSCSDRSSPEWIWNSKTGDVTKV